MSTSPSSPPAPSRPADNTAAAAPRPRVALLMEQLLGHITHTDNLRRYLAEATPPFEPEVINIPTGVWARRWERARRDNILAIWLDGMTALRSARGRIDAAFLHTQGTAMFCGPIMRTLPTVVSLDATPLQFQRLYFPDLRVPEGLPPLTRLRIAVVKATDIKKRLIRQVFARARHFVTWSEWAKGSLVADYGVPADRVTVIPPGVDVERFAPDPAARPDDGVVRLLFVGGDFGRKGGDDLLRWARETAVGRRWELHLVTREAVADVPPGVVIHTGVTNNSRPLIDLYRRCDLFVLPTRADCTPLVTMEAAASGLPVVTTRVAGLPELVRDNETGYLIDVGDFDALRARLDTLVTDDALRARLGAAAREMALRSFDFRANWGRVCEVIAAVAAPARR